jgi:hypothetical protein
VYYGVLARIEDIRAVRETWRRMHVDAELRQFPGDCCQVTGELHEFGSRHDIGEQAAVVRH